LSIARRRPEVKDPESKDRWSDERLSFLGRVSFWGPFTSVLAGDLRRGLRPGVQRQGRNLLDEFPDRAIFDNSFGIFNFPSASPFGFNGRYLYLRTDFQAW
jgi:hypothetical protein